MKTKFLLIGMMTALLLAGCAGEGTRGEAGQTEKDPAVTAPVEEQEGNGAEEVNAPKFLDLDRLREGQFGFADRTGQRLITIEGEKPSKHSNSYELAIGDAGTVLKIKYHHSQTVDAKDNGRATMYNFEHMSGDVYAVTEGTAKPNETYFLIASEHWASDSALSVDSSAKGRAADESSVKAIETAKKRAVVKAEEVASIGEDGKLFLAEFEKQGDDVLASLVLQKNEELLFHDFPGQNDPNSTWRIDDQGAISAKEFNVMFAGKGENGPILAVTWLGAEGENEFILAQEGSALKETEIQAGRYMVPV